MSLPTTELKSNSQLGSDIKASYPAQDGTQMANGINKLEESSQKPPDGWAAELSLDSTP